MAAPAADSDAHRALELQGLAEAWGAVYLVSFDGTQYRAACRYDGTDLKADTPAGLESAIRAHWSRSWEPCGGGSQ